MNIFEQIKLIVISLAIAVFLFAETGRADDVIVPTSISSFVFLNQKDGKKTVVCHREADGTFKAGAASYNKKKNTWSWRSYESDLRKILKPGKILTAKTAKKYMPIYAKLEQATNTCVATEKAKLIGNWSTQYDCSKFGLANCFETFTYAFYPDGVFAFFMDGVASCPSGVGEAATGFALLGYYTYNGNIISLSQVIFDSYRDACPDRPAATEDRNAKASGRGIAYISNDGLSMQMDLFCPTNLKSEKNTFFCDQEMMTNFVKQ